MKKLLVCFLLTLFGCTEDPPADPSTQTIDTNDKDGLRIRVIDSCQYLEYNYGEGNYRVYSLTHKGNCDNPTHPVAP